MMPQLKYTIPILSFLLFASFSNRVDNKNVVITGTLIDYETNEPVSNYDSFTTSNLQITHDHGFDMVQGKTNEAGVFYMEGEFYEVTDKFISLYFYRAATLNFFNYVSGDTIDLGKVYLVRYDSERKVQAIRKRAVCDSQEGLVTGKPIEEVISIMKERAPNYTPKEDSLSIGRGRPKKGKPDCWYRYKILTFDVDVSTDSE